MSDSNSTVNRTKILEGLARMRKMSPMADLMMRAFFRGRKDIVSLMLQIIMGIPTLRVIEMNLQADLKRVHGERGVTLDILAEDADGTIYNIEFQNDEDGADPRRARYHGSVMDVEMLDEGQDWRKLHRRVVIFITRDDCFGLGEPVYRFRLKEAAHDLDFGDDTEFIYVNGAYEGFDDIGDLIHDLRTVEPEDMRIPLMAERMAYLRKTPEGESYMYDSIKDIMKDIIDEATSRQLEARNREFAARLIRKYWANLNSDAIKEIAEMSDLSEDTVRQLANQMKNEGMTPVAS